MWSLESCGRSPAGGAGPSDAWGGVRLWEQGSGKPGLQPRGKRQGGGRGEVLGWWERGTWEMREHWREGRVERPKEMRKA